MKRDPSKLTKHESKIILDLSFEFPMLKELFVMDAFIPLRDDRKLKYKDFTVIHFHSTHIHQHCMLNPRGKCNHFEVLADYFILKPLMMHCSSNLNQVLITSQNGCF